MRYRFIHKRQKMILQLHSPSSRPVFINDWVYANIIDLQYFYKTCEHFNFNNKYKWRFTVDKFWFREILVLQIQKVVVDIENFGSYIDANRELRWVNATFEDYQEMIK